MCYWLVLFIATHWPGLQLHAPDGRNIGELQADKLLHFGAFALLALLACLARLGGAGASPARHVWCGSLLAGAYAALDEGSQVFPILDRTFSWLDLIANLAGVLAVLLAGLLATHARRREMSWPVTLARAALGFALPAGTLILFLPGLWLAPFFPVPGRTMRYVLGWRFDWLFHLAASAAALWLMALAAPFGVQRRWLNRATALALVVVTGPVIEYVQTLAGRANERGDLVAHELGAAMGLLVAGAYLLAGRQAGKGRAAAPASEPPRPRGESTRGRVGSRTNTAFVGGAAVVSALTLLSRVTGLLREAVLAAVFGRSPVADAFVFGFQVPNLFRRLFGEGALSAALIPVYADLLYKDRLTAQRLAWACAGLLLVTLGAVTLAGELVLAAMLALGDWSPHNALAIRLTMLMLPYMPMVCLVAIFGAILQVHHRFASTAAAPVLLNLVVCAAALFGTLGHDDPVRAVYLVSMSVIAAGALQLAWQFAAVVRVEKLVTVFAGVAPGMNTLLRRFIPTAIGLGIFQINTFLDNVIAMGLRAGDDGARHFFLFGWKLPLPLDTGDVAALAWAQRLYEFPLGIFGIAIATAIFPALARAAASDRADFREILRHGLRLTVFIGLPASAGLVLCGLPLVRVIFERRQFSLEDSRIVTLILAGYAPAIWAYSMNHVITRAFYSLGDTRTPLIVSTAMVMLNLMLNLTLVWFLGPAGFAWATAVCAIIQCVLLLAAIRPYVDNPVGAAVWAGWARTLLLTVVMAAVLYPLATGYDAGAMTLRQAALLLSGLVTLGAAVVVCGAWLLKAEELRWLLRRSAR